MLVFTVKESSGGEAARLRAHAGGQTGSKLLLVQPEDPLGQEPAEEQSAGVIIEEVLLMNEAYQNVSFRGEVELEDGVSGSGGGRVAPPGVPSAVQAVVSPQVPSGKPAAADQEASSEVSVPLTNVDAEELNSGGRRVKTGPGKNECIPLLTRAEGLRGAGAGSATAKADPVDTPEAAIEGFFQLLAGVALPEAAVDARILLEDQAVVAATFGALFGDEEAKILTAEKSSEDGPGAVGEEAL